MRFARIENGVVVETVDLPEGIEPGAAYVPVVAERFLPVSGAVEVGWMVDGGEYAPPPPATPPLDLTAYVAHRRYAVETGGIDVAGHPIATDRESQALIMGARLYAQATPTATIQFKAGAGFVTLDAAAIETIAIAVATHVQAAFAIEAAVLADIAAGAITTIEQVDGAAWPGGEPQGEPNGE